MVKIYTLSNPINNEIRYVGKTIESLNERLRKHLIDKRRNHKSNWVKSLINVGLKPKIELIEECDINDWNWLEKYWIEQFRAWGFNLTNICEGGRGSNGFKHSKETIEKLRNNSLGNKNRVGIKHTNESKIKMRLSHLNVKLSEEHKKSIRQSKIGISCGVGRKHTKKHKLNIKKGVINKIGKKIYQLDLSENIIDEWDSISLASEALNIPASNIVNVCKGNRKTARGFKFKYKKEV